MKYRKVRLDDAYLEGKIGFSYFLNDLEGKDSDDFYKSMLLDYDNNSYDGIPIDEIIFYVLGFFDDYAEENKRRKEKGLPPISIENEKWIKKLMDKVGVDKVEDLGYTMVKDLMDEIEYIYREPREVLSFINNRIDKKSTYIREKLRKEQSRDWSRLEAKERRER